MRKQAEMTGSEGKFLTKLHVNSYKVPKGLYLTFNHMGNCLNGNKEEAWNRLITSGEPKSISELNALLRALFGMSGCDGCHVEKTTLAGLLFEHSQDSLFSKGQTPSDQDSYVSTETASDMSESWPASEIITQLPLSEQKLYGSKFKLDNSSDSDYVPPRQVRTARPLGSAQDVQMTMEGGTNTENTGLGNSKWVGSQSDGLPETVTYTQTKSQNELMLEELEKVNTSEAVPAVVEMDTVMRMEDVEPVREEEVLDMGMEARMARMEIGIGIMRDEIDELRDFKEITETEGCKFCIGTKGKLVSELTKEKVKVVPSVPAIPLGPKVQNAKRGPAKTILKRDVSRVADVAPISEPSYENRTPTFAQKAREGTTKKEFSIVANRKRFAKKAGTPEVVTGISVWERHLKIRFETAKGTVTRLPEGVTQASIRDGLNECLRNLNERKIYFSMVGQNRFGNVLLILADSRAEEVLPYIRAMEGRLERMGLAKFRFEKDTEKAKIFVGSVPLKQAGKDTWKCEDWDGENAFRRLANDIELSNPGITLASKPSWVGKLTMMKNRRQSTAGLLIVVDLNDEVRKMMGKEFSKITVAGKSRFCRAWKEENPSVVCTRCLKIGHVGAGCVNEPVCKWCRQKRLTLEHSCPVTGCEERHAGCKHTRKWCVPCQNNCHFTGDDDCPAVKRSSGNKLRVQGSPIVSDPSSVSGVADRSINRERNRMRNGRGTPLTESMAAEERIPGNIGLMEKESLEERKRNQINVIAPGSAIERYERLGVVDGTDVVRAVRGRKLNKGKQVARSASVPEVKRNSEEMSQEADMGFSLDLFENTPSN